MKATIRIQSITKTNFINSSSYSCNCKRYNWTFKCGRCVCVCCCHCHHFFFDLEGHHFDREFLHFIRIQLNVSFALISVHCTAWCSTTPDDKHSNSILFSPHKEPITLIVMHTWLYRLKFYMFKNGNKELMWMQTKTFDNKNVRTKKLFDSKSKIECKNRDCHIYKSGLTFCHRCFWIFFYFFFFFLFFVCLVLFTAIVYAFMVCQYCKYWFFFSSYMLLMSILGNSQNTILWFHHHHHRWIRDGSNIRLDDEPTKIYWDLRI